MRSEVFAGLVNKAVIDAKLYTDNMLDPFEIPTYFTPRSKRALIKYLNEHKTQIITPEIKNLVYASIIDYQLANAIQIFTPDTEIMILRESLREYLQQFKNEHSEVKKIAESKTLLAMATALARYQNKYKSE